MTDLREAVARAIRKRRMQIINQRDDIGEDTSRLTEMEIELAAEATRAIEAAGYAVVPRALAVTTDADAVAAARFASLEDTTLLAKET